MPKTHFNDFDEFADAVNGIAGRFVATEGADADWWIQTVKLGSISAQQFQIGSAAAFVGQGRADALTVGIPLSAPQGGVRIDGEDLHENSFVLVAAHQPFAVGAQGPMKWAGITIPLDHPDLPPELSKTFSRQGASTRVASPAAYLNRLRITLRELFSAHSDGSLDARTCRFAGEQVVSLMSHVLEGGDGLGQAHFGRPAYSRARVLARALEAIEQGAGKPLFVQDLCRATQVSERTLRRIFWDYFGVSPMRLLKVRRLQGIRAALMAADHDRDDAIWKVAARFGVWDLSAFAADYKSLFGELPHQTFRRMRLAEIKLAPGTDSKVKRKAHES